MAIITRYGRSLKEYRRYDVETALRGPDVAPSGCFSKMGFEDDFDTLKQEVTCRIRALYFTGNFHHGLWNDVPLKQSVVDRVERALVHLNDLKTRGPYAYALWRGEQHFLDHLHRAVKATVDHPVWGGLGEELRKTIHRYI